MNSIKKKCEVIMLPTDKITKVLRNTYITKAHKGVNPLTYGTVDNAINRGYEYNHLYVVTDAVILVGEYYVNESNYIIKAINKGYLTDTDLIGKRKIIASTDKGLGLLSIPFNFLESYCDAGGINEIRVGFNTPQCYDGEININGLDILLPVIKWVKGEKTVVIHESKKMWTKSEVENILFDAALANLYEDGRKTDISINIIKNWFENKLQNNGD